MLHYLIGNRAYSVSSWKNYTRISSRRQSTRANTRSNATLCQWWPRKLSQGLEGEAWLCASTCFFLGNYESSCCDPEAVQVSTLANTTASNSVLRAWAVDRASHDTCKPFNQIKRRQSAAGEVIAQAKSQRIGNARAHQPPRNTLPAQQGASLIRGDCLAPTISLMLPLYPKYMRSTSAKDHTTKAGDSTMRWSSDENT